MLPMKVDVTRIVGTSEFRAHTAAIFDEVENGATYVITRGSRPVAVLAPVRNGELPTVAAHPPAHQPIDLE